MTPNIAKEKVGFQVKQQAWPVVVFPEGESFPSGIRHEGLTLQRTGLLRVGWDTKEAGLSVSLVIRISSRRVEGQLHGR